MKDSGISKSLSVIEGAILSGVGLRLTGNARSGPYVPPIPLLRNRPEHEHVPIQDVSDGDQQGEQQAEQGRQHPQSHRGVHQNNLPAFDQEEIAAGIGIARHPAAETGLMLTAPRIRTESKEQISRLIVNILRLRSGGCACCRPRWPDPDPGVRSPARGYR